MDLQVHYFPIQDSDLKKFIRKLPADKDCVINAIQLIGLIDARTADLMRILVGNKGIDKDEIEKIFKWVIPEYYWEFSYLPINHKNKEFIEVIFKDIPSKHIIFCGVTFNNGNNHVIIIGKTKDNQLVSIDPQAFPNPIILGFNNIKKYYLSNAQIIYFLRSSDIPSPPDDLMDWE